MIIGQGRFSCRNAQNLEGSFLLRRKESGGILFETSVDFNFGWETGPLPSAPGFALHIGDPTGLSSGIVGASATQTDFMRLAGSCGQVSGTYHAILPVRFDLSIFDTVILWCHASRRLLGVGAIDMALAEENRFA